jgi:hypothetical protein
VPWTNNNTQKAIRKKIFFARSLFTVSAVAVFHSVVGIGQFLLNHSVGLFALFESRVATDIAGTAKIILGTHEQIRAYGLFPHPNIFAGFLIFSIFATAFLLLQSHYTYIFNQSRVSARFVKVLLSLFLFFQILALFFTVSRTAIVALFLAIIYYWTITRLHTIRMVWKGALLIIGVLSFIALLYYTVNLTSLLSQSLEERLVFLEISERMIHSHFISGVGFGQFVLYMQEFSPYLLEPWRYQPVHMVYALIFSELGIVGILLFFFFLHTHTSGYGIQNSTLRSLPFYPYFAAVFFAYLFIALFDHYFWDILQAQIYFWLVFGITFTPAVLFFQKNSDQNGNNSKRF